MTADPPPDPARSRRSAPRATVKAAADDLFDASLPVEAAVDRHYGPGFRQRTNAKWDDRGQLVAGVAALRPTVARVTVTVLDDIHQGER